MRLIFVEVGNLRGILRFDDSALQLHTWRQFAVFHGPLFWNDRDPLHAFEVRELSVYEIDDFLVQLKNSRFRDQ